MANEKDSAEAKKAADEARAKAAKADEARLKAHDDKTKREDEETEEQLEKERSGKAAAKDHNETSGQNRQKSRADAKDNAGQTKMHTLRNPQTGAEMEVSQNQWRAESQMLRQQGWERADVLADADPGGEGATGEPGSEGGGGA